MTRSTVKTIVADKVLDRDQGRCVRCGRYVAEGERSRDYSVHHRRIKGMGGDRRWNTDLPGNLIILCGDGVSGCHGRVHLDERLDALAHGWIIPRSTEDPTQEPVLRGGIWVYLDNDGGALEAKPEPAVAP